MSTPNANKVAARYLQIPLRVQPDYGDPEDTSAAVPRGKEAFNKYNPDDLLTALVDILEKYAQVTHPQPGGIWRANFYKCADKTSHPHWLTWSVVDKPRPDFHVPQFFGILEFEEK